MFYFCLFFIHNLTRSTLLFSSSAYPSYRDDVQRPTERNTYDEDGAERNRKKLICCTLLSFRKTFLYAVLFCVRIETKKEENFFLWVFAHALDICIEFNEFVIYYVDFRDSMSCMTRNNFHVVCFCFCDFLYHSWDSSVVRVSH